MPVQSKTRFGFNQGAADAVYKAMTAMDEQSALVYGRILVADAVHYDLIAHRDELAKIAQQQIEGRAQRLREHYTRTAVAKTRAGQDATHEITCLVQIGKAWGFSTADRQRFAAGRTRGEGGRFVVEHRRIDTDNTKPPITDQSYSEQLGIPKSQLEGEDLAHYQQAYSQIQDLLAPFHNANNNALLHVHILEDDGQTQRTEVHGFDKKKGKILPDIAAGLGPEERIESASVSVAPKMNSAGAALDVFAAAGAPRVGGYVGNQLTSGALNPKRLETYNETRTKVDDNENFSAGARAFGRLEHGSRILQDGLGDVAPRKLQYALAVANHVGQYGPEAQKVIGPAADRAAYRYRGTERELDTGLTNAFDQLRTSGFRTRSSQDIREIAIGGFERAEGWDPGPVLRYFHRRLPKTDLNELHRRSGVIPPSEGIIVGGNGKIAHQAVGYADDWYLPFNLRHLGALRGGEYIRTRSFGGPTTEDIYTGLVSGARSLTVISHNGVFTVDFDRNLRGGRRFNDKAARMVARYGQLLDAVRSEQISRGGISPSRNAELRADVLQRFEPNEASPAFRSRLKELQAEERRNPKLSQQESDTAATEWLDAEAARRTTGDGRMMTRDELTDQFVRSAARTGYQASEELAARNGMPSQMTEGQYLESVRLQLDAAGTTTDRIAGIAKLMGQTTRFDRAMARANDDNAKRARTLKLDGAGYDAALTALQEQFPYYIQTKYTPWRNSMGIGAMEDQARETAKDTGYVAPRFNRPQEAEAGYFNHLVGQKKVEASSIRYQNYRVHGGKLRPVKSDTAGAGEPAATTATPAASGTTAAGTTAAAAPHLQHAANMALLDDLLTNTRFSSEAKLGTESIGDRLISAEVEHPRFPDGPLQRIFKTPRPELDAVPVDEMTELLKKLLNTVEAGKLLSVNKGKAYAVRNGGKAAPMIPAPSILSEKLAGVDDDHTFPGIAYDATRTPDVGAVESTYTSEPTIGHLVKTNELTAAVSDPDFDKKIKPLKTRLQESVNAFALLSSMGGRPDPAARRQNDLDADGLLRATQLRRNWVAAKARADAAAAAAAPAVGGNNGFFTNLSMEEMARLMPRAAPADPNVIDHNVIES